MTLTRMEYVAAVLSVLLMMGIMGVGNQHQAFAAEVPVDPCEDIFPNIPGMPGCDDAGGGNGGGGTQNPPVDPCDHVFPNIPNMPECDGGGSGGGGGTTTDVCPNIDGVQTEVPAGKVIVDGQCVDEDPGNGGGGGENPGGGSGSTDPSPSGGGSGGSGSCPPYADPCTDGVTSGGSSGSVLGATTTATTTETVATTTPEVISCSPHITTFIKAGQENDAEQVRRLQSILKSDGADDVEETGEYDAKSEAAVRAFQIKYAADILTPWDITEPTGYVFLTTRKKLNELYCDNVAQFPLTPEEKRHIEQVREESPAPTVAGVQTQVTPEVMAEEEPDQEEVEAEDSAEEPVTTMPGRGIGDFFRRLFDRFR